MLIVVSPPLTCPNSFPLPFLSLIRKQAGIQDIKIKEDKIKTNKMEKDKITEQEKELKENHKHVWIQTHTFSHAEMS